MAAPAQLSQLLQQIPEPLLRLAETPTETLAARYAPLFRGFEKYGFTDPKMLSAYRYQFEQGLRDLAACLKCDGTACRTSVEGPTRLYYGLDRGDIEFYGGKRPSFRLFRCPGPAERKEQLRKILVSDREDPGQSERGQMPW